MYWGVLVGTGAYWGTQCCRLGRTGMDRRHTGAYRGLLACLLVHTGGYWCACSFTAGRWSMLFCTGLYWYALRGTLVHSGAYWDVRWGARCHVYWSILVYTGQRCGCMLGCILVLTGERGRSLQSVVRAGPRTGSCWFILGRGAGLHTGSYWSILVHTGQRSERNVASHCGDASVLPCIDLKKPKLVRTGLYWCIAVLRGAYWSILVLTGAYWSILGRELSANNVGARCGDASVPAV